MNFQKKPNRSYQKIPGYSAKRRPSDAWKAWLWVAIIFLSIPVVIGASWFWLNILRDLPDISEIENYNFKQATTITDRN
jgi:hypothetical protein